MKVKDTAILKLTEKEEALLTDVEAWCFEGKGNPIEKTAELSDGYTLELAYSLVNGNNSIQRDAFLIDKKGQVCCCLERTVPASAYKNLLDERITLKDGLEADDISPVFTVDVLASERKREVQFPENAIGMSPERMRELLGRVVDHISAAEDTCDTICKLLDMGFESEELVSEFGFRKGDVEAYASYFEEEREQE